MTQEQLAEAANLSVPDSSHMERGFKRPSPETLVRLAVAWALKRALRETA